MIKNIFKAFVILFAFIACSSDDPTDQDPFQMRVDQIIGNEPDFNGFLLIGNSEEITYSSGFGFSERENDVPITINTVFDIGSITKPFTAMGIVKCEEKGLLSYNDRLGDIFMNIPSDKAAITILDLLTHRSGFVESIGDDYQEITTEEFIEESMETKLLFEPGTEYAYSNVGFSILGIIIEKLSATTYEQFLKQEIFDPAGMTTAGYVIPDYESAEVANGYDDQGVFSDPGTNLGKPFDLPWDDEGPFWHLKGNGGLLMAASDIHAFYKALSGNELFSEAQKTAMYTRYIQEGQDNTYVGLGWSLGNTRLGSSAMHNGGNDVFFADLVHSVERDQFVFLASNAARLSQEDLISKILQEL
ncbi:MAG: serine hydrolase [Cyclobacteriaceae bacterium]|nr:serine hydrolase [Cyclobacteriaceae bacterium HetDA_MAG_MS6]